MNLDERRILVAAARWNSCAARSRRPCFAYSVASAWLSRAEFGFTRRRRSYETLRQTQIGLTESIRVLVVLWRHLDETAIFVDDTLDAARSLIGIGELDVRRRLGRHQFDRAFQRDDRLRGPIQGEKAHAGQQARGTERRIEPRRCLKLDQRVLMAAALLKDDAEVVMDEAALAALAEHLAEHLLRAIQVAGP